MVGDVLTIIASVKIYTVSQSTLLVFRYTYLLYIYFILDILYTIYVF